MLTTVLRTNALSCLGFGALFAVRPTSVSNFVGDPPVWLVLAIGVVLMLNGIHLAWASLRTTPPLELRYFAAGDFIWVVATALMITGGIWITTTFGIAVAVAIGLMVGTFGTLQWRIAGQACSADSQPDA